MTLTGVAETVGTTLVHLHLLGVLVAMGVMRVRAGTGLWYGLRVFGPGGHGIVWIATVAVCSMVWPITLAVWLLRGRPEPRVVFNDKAFERLRRQAAGGVS
jgi:hypothetical protein